MRDPGERERRVEAREGLQDETARHQVEAGTAELGRDLLGRRADDALGASPAALLAGGSLERDFVLAPDPPRDGRDEQLAWVRATPRAEDSGFAWIAVGLRGALPERIEILDRFGQRTMLRFVDFEPDVPIERGRFVFTPPAGTDVVEQ